MNAITSLVCFSVRQVLGVEGVEHVAAAVWKQRNAIIIPDFKNPDELAQFFCKFDDALSFFSLQSNAIVLQYNKERPWGRRWTYETP